MKITVYTITDCQFCQQEKEYLASHNLPFEEKNLEQNREWLTEMLAVSNNFSGTPVTKIEKDDGKTEVLKGFTKEEFNQAFPPPVSPQTPPTPPSPQPPPPSPADPLNSILNDLQTKATSDVAKTAEPAPQQPINPPAQSPAPENLPNIPDPNFK